MIAQFAVLVLVVAAAVWATAALVRWPWSLWVRAEQKKVLAHKSPTNTPLPAMAGVVGMWMVISLLMFSLYRLAQGDFPNARELLDNPGHALTPLIGIFGGGAGLAALAYGADVVFRWLGSKYRAFRSYRASRKASR
jgi:hypothetical protein